MKPTSNRTCEFELDLLDGIGAKIGIRPCGAPATCSTDVGGGASYWCKEHADLIAADPDNDGIEFFQIRPVRS